MNKRTTIKDVADVLLGYTFRSSLEGRIDSDIVVLQARNITDELILTADQLMGIDLEASRTSAVVRNNDVILSLRGSYKSAVMKIDSGMVIAASSVYIIRIKNNNLLPEYLAVYLNSKFTKKQISERATGGAINSLLRKDLESINVVIPSLEEQRKVVETYENNLRYQKLLKQKIFLADKVNEGLINRLINS